MGTGKRKRRLEAKQLQAVRRMLRNTGVPSSAPSRPAGSTAKMSETLMEFAEPLLDYTEDEEKAYALAAIAWNVSLMPKERWPGILEDAMELMPAADHEARVAFKEILRAMALQKLERYPEDDRMILSWHFAGSGKSRVFNVASVRPG